MSNVCRVRIQSKRDGDVKKMILELRKALKDEGFNEEWRRCQYYESKSEKRRRKEKASKIRRQKESN